MSWIERECYPGPVCYLFRRNPRLVFRLWILRQREEEPKDVFAGDTHSLNPTSFRTTFYKFPMAFKALSHFSLLTSSFQFSYPPTGPKIRLKSPFHVSELLFKVSLSMDLLSTSSLFYQVPKAFSMDLSFKYIFALLQHIFEVFEFLSYKFG
jgi:hypothetical protein